MFPYFLIAFVSALISFLFLVIKIKNDIRSLLSSYGNSSKLMSKAFSDNDEASDAFTNELKVQFKLLAILTLKLALILLPLTAILIYSYYNPYETQKFYDVPSLLISLAVFVVVYYSRRYGKSE
jgi:hypothetical protein